MAELTQTSPPLRSSLRDPHPQGRTQGVEGTIYLLHFDRPYRHARHYMGWTTDLDARLSAHANGQGARLMAVLRSVGISFTLARTWTGDRNRERTLKNMKCAPRLCPICQEGSN